MLPFAVPSSLVSTTPMSTTSAKTRACGRLFWPMVASSTSSTSSTFARFSDDALDPVELVHQTGLGVQAARRIHHDDVSARCDALVDGVERHEAGSVFSRARSAPHGAPTRN